MKTNFLEWKRNEKYIAVVCSQNNFSSSLIHIIIYIVNCLASEQAPQCHQQRTTFGQRKKKKTKWQKQTFTLSRNECGKKKKIWWKMPVDKSALMELPIMEKLSLWKLFSLYVRNKKWQKNIVQHFIHTITSAFSSSFHWINLSFHSSWKCWNVKEQQKLNERRKKKKKIKHEYDVFPSKIYSFNDQFRATPRKQ